MTQDSSQRVRWRMTLGELCAACDASAAEISAWAQVGALGKRLQERRDQGWARHITRETAQRVVLMARLRRAGLNVSRAAEIAATHERNDREPLRVLLGTHVEILIDRYDLP